MLKILSSSSIVLTISIGCFFPISLDFIRLHHSRCVMSPRRETGLVSWGDEVTDILHICSAIRPFLLLVNCEHE